MKIAIVTPQPTPIAIGGAENLWWGLQDHIQNNTDHHCDIVSVLSPESTFPELISSYETFSKLDLSAYDCVISGKYPAWMVNHPNHICYMLHRLRGLYDTYSADIADEALLASEPAKGIATWLKQGIGNPDPDRIPELFDRLRNLQSAPDAGSLLRFPGPLSRLVIHFLDNAALSPERIRNYAAISRTVVDRKSYFPAEVPVDVLYPPPHLLDYFCGNSDYFFTSSRLDRPKRIDLIIEAMRDVNHDIPLLIAGTGPDEARLKALADGDSRIKFLGFVPDSKMQELYANARAVPFVPMDEDYGLITIEAMKSSKPVVTVRDSGGPCEFVVHNETGMICDPDPALLGECLNELAEDREKAVTLGQAAYRKVEAITWANVADGLLQQRSAIQAASASRRPKLTVATTFRSFPPMNGGQARVFHLYRNLAKFYDIDIISLGEASDTRQEREIAPGVLEIIVPKSEAHSKAENEISLSAGGKPVSDVAANTLLDLTPAYGEAIELSGLTSDAIVACHPYTFNVIKQSCPKLPLWYEAQDVEMTLKTAVFQGEAAAKPLLDEVEKAERNCWVHAARVFACAERDLDQLEELYGPTLAQKHEVPNGVSLDDVPYVSLSERRKLQQAGGIRDEQLAIFLGSWHGPNLEAVEDILKAAPDRPQTRFVIVGSVCGPFKDKTLPPNVELLGMVDMETRDLMLSLADVALNPMRSGTGTNLKMLDYMAAGVPVISTEFGARGLKLEAGKHYLRSENTDLNETLQSLSEMKDEELESMILLARAQTEAEYSWQVIASQFLSEIS